jgi:hypothetical protein
VERKGTERKHLYICSGCNQLIRCGGGRRKRWVGSQSRATKWSEDFPPKT